MQSQQNYKRFLEGQDIARRLCCATRTSCSDTLRLLLRQAYCHHALIILAINCDDTNTHTHAAQQFSSCKHLNRQTTRDAPHKNSKCVPGPTSVQRLSIHVASVAGLQQ
eukprot:1741-Heterococcus_DN1.PRE.1